MGRFLLGFMMGAAVSAAAVLIYTPRSGEETRRSLTESFHVALDAGRAAAAAREQELWNEFHQSLKASQAPAGDQPQLPPS